jgi:hypothetical protein
LPRIALAVLTASLILAAPAAAQARGGGGGGGRGAVPARVNVKLRAAESALQRASDHAGDGEAAAAVSSFATVRRNLAAAQKSALAHLTPATVAAVAQLDDDVVDTTAGTFDGLTGDPVDAAALTLKAALDSRDALVTAVAALAADAKAGYEYALAAIRDDVADEADGVTETLAEDELTDPAKAALNAASAQLTAAGTAVAAQLTALGASSADGSTSTGDDDRPCPAGHGGGGGPGGGGFRGGGS